MLSCNRIQSLGHCSDCQVELTETNRLKNRAQCRDCRSKYFKGWYKKNTKKTISRNTQNYHKGYKGKLIERKYGITLTAAIAMWESQGCACASCRQPIAAPGKAKTTHIDHCHTTGKVRGILCHGCNVSLGMLKDNPEYIKGLLSYLEKSIG